MTFYRCRNNFAMSASFVKCEVCVRKSVLLYLRIGALLAQSRMDRKQKCTIVGALVGGLLFFCVYFFSMYARLSVDTVMRILVFPTVFGVAAGGAVGYELGALRRRRTRMPQGGEYGDGRLAGSVEVEQKKAENVEGGVK